MKNSVLICSALLILFACQSNFNENELNFNPYKKGDVLIFQSNSGEKDTLKIGQIIQLKNSAAQIALFPDKLATLIVDGKYNDLTNGYVRPTSSSILEINKVNNEPATVLFEFGIEDARFYHGKYDQKIEDILKQVKVKMKIGGKAYNDIVFVEPESNEYADREHFISKIYWSLKDGYVRYDLKNGKVWELMSKN